MKQKFRLKERIFFISCPLFVIVFILLAYTTNIFDSIESKVLDFRFRYLNQHLPASQEIVFVDVDEYSLNALSPYFGGWPWPRNSAFGEMLHYMMEGEPAAVIFDILFTELSSKKVEEDISEEDSNLAAASLIYPNLSHASQFSLMEEQEKLLGMPESSSYNFEIKVDDSRSKVRFPHFNGYQLPFPLLNECSSHVHFVNHVEDNDGISRRCNMLLKYNGKYYPSLSLRALMIKLKIEEIILEEQDLLLMRGGELVRKVQLDQSGRFYLNFYDTLERFSDNTISAAGLFHDLLKRKMGKLEGIQSGPEFFKDKIVIIGSSANGLKDIKVTPMGKNFAGPFIHITAISNILNQQRVHPVSLLWNIFITCFLVISLFLSTLLIKNKYIKNAFGFVFLGAYLLISFLLFQYGGIILNVTIPLLSMIVIYLSSLIFVSVTEESERRRVQAAMGKYLAPSVMEEVLKNYEELVGEVGQKKDITVLFSDIRSFTTFSEKYHPETVVSILNRYLEKMIDVIFEYKGTLDKIVGDEIMAFWGAPSLDSQQDYHAVKTAMVMQEKLEELNRELEEEGYPSLKNGVGINTGDMIVGNIGSAKRLDYTLIGDNVNLGARIEGLTKYYRVKILITESTFERVKEQFLCVFIDIVAVKGKSQGIKIYSPLAEYDGLQEEERADLEKEVKEFEIAASLYFQRQFFQAGKLFLKGKEEFQVLNLLSEEFQKRCEHFMENPPSKSWDGTWTMTEK